jgi:hypothetical protein
MTLHVAISDDISLYPGQIALVVCAIVFPIVGGIKANNGEVWRYPLSIAFFK